ncbi:MAG: c-type cytochrome [Candidatus Acidiferrum sp.]
MSAEEMGKVPYGLRLTLAVMSVVFLLVLAISPVKDTLLPWRSYKRQYVQFANSRPEHKSLLADFQPGVDQIWVPQLDVVDRCETCHQGINQPSLTGASVPFVFRTHSPVPHSVVQWGCVSCHRGQGRATEVREAHETTLAWEQPILPTRYIQASCGACHQDKLIEAPKLTRGRELIARFNCIGCHKLEGVTRPKMLGPDLTNVGTKVSREWIYKWLKEPRTIMDKDGNVAVDGVKNEDEPRMPQFSLSEQELRALSAFLSTQKHISIPPAKFDPRVLTTWAKKPETVDQGELRFRQMFCTTCHAVAVTRAGETILIGGDIGPELTKVGTKVNTNWLVAWLRSPEGYLPHTVMPRYGWSDEDLYKVTRYIQEKLTDPSLLSDVPQFGAPTDAEIEQGKRLFMQKGCSSCHLIEGIATPTEFGPDLSKLGGKTISQLEFGQSKIPRNLIAYIRAKVTDPHSVNPAARMPQFHLTPDDLDAITTALLSMTGEPPTPAWGQLRIPATHPVFRPAGEFGEVFNRYKCYDCHKFNGYGGTLAPDLSFEGSRAQRSWLIAFLKNPQTLRPILTFRMPQFNMTDQETAVIADYLGTAMQSSDVQPGVAEKREYTPELAKLGKELYEVKYQCQSCHTIGSSGGYVGPSLNNAGQWLRPQWIEAWLRDPQALDPQTIDPRLSLTDKEVKALTAYLMTLQQSSASNKASSGGTP